MMQTAELLTKYQFMGADIFVNVKLMLVLCVTHRIRQTCKRLS